MNAHSLMVQGTTSDAGKSLLVTALCRWLKRKGVRVAPFKPQNMALNSAVTVDGGEIGRSQAVQAMAAGVDAQTDMNPVLLKPNSDIGAQVIIQGQARGNMDACDYHDYKRIAFNAVCQSYQRLQDVFDVVVIEGAGSPAEINLRENDIANMGFAEAVDCPVILIADIDRGGVFAHLVGTLNLLTESEQSRVKGFVINRFRGDLALLQPGLDWLTEKTGKPVIGVLPYLQGLHLEAEDALPIVPTQHGQHTLDKVRICVPALPRISNHTDFDPLRLHPQVNFRFVGPGQAIPACDLIILPGSKSVRADLGSLIQQGWDKAILRHLRYGGKLIGICGGFQMLGDVIRDPHGIEGQAGDSVGLALLRMQTTLKAQKQLRNVSGCLFPGMEKVFGYEIHAGTSTGTAFDRAALQLEQRPEGALSEDGQILGTYLHGLFDSNEACVSLLEWAGQGHTRAKQHDYQALKAASIDRLADAVEQHLDTNILGELMYIDRFKQ